MKAAKIMSEKLRNEESEAKAPEERKKLMVRVVCQWCNKEMGMKEIESGGMGENDITHGICEECLKRSMGEIEKK